VEVDENIVVTEIGNLCFLLKLEAVKTILTDDGPLLSGGRRHGDCSVCN